MYVISGVTGGRGQGAECPRDIWPGNFCWSIGKREARKKGKWSRKEGKSKKGSGKLKIGGGKVSKNEKTFVVVVVVCLFCFVLCVCGGGGLCLCVFWGYLLFTFQTTKICFGLPKWKFSTGKTIRKNNFPPLKNIALTPLYVVHQSLNRDRWLSDVFVAYQSLYQGYMTEWCIRSLSITASGIDDWVMCT